MAVNVGFWVPILTAPVLVVAAYSDIRYRVLPDAVSVLLVIFAILRWGLTGEWHTLLWAVVCGAAVFAAGALAFARGLLGGGDVKMAAATSILVGAGAVPTFLVIMSLVGGILSVIILVWHYGASIFGYRDLSGPSIDSGADRTDAGPSTIKPTVPYGVAIACAGLYVLAAQCRMGVN